LRRIYGLSVDQHSALLAAQNGKCAVCEKAPAKRTLCVDHNHATGEVRGLVCIGCNLLIYQIERADAIARSARAYLAHPPARSILYRAKIEKDATLPMFDAQPLTLVKGGK
jgi:hypothetical protein